MSNEQTHTERANIGVVGLAVMRANLARNLASREGNTVAVRNIDAVKAAVGESDELILPLSGQDWPASHCCGPYARISLRKSTSGATTG